MVLAFSGPVNSPGSRISVYAALTAQAIPRPLPDSDAAARARNLYFWARLLCILFLAMAGVIALYEGIARPNLGLVGGAIGFETASLALASTLRAQLPRAVAVRSIRDCADAMPGVTQVERVLTMRVGGDRLMVALGLRFESDLTRREIFATAERLKRAIRRAHPHVERVFMAVHGDR
jgi:zinc transporter family protein